MRATALGVAGGMTTLGSTGAQPGGHRAFGHRALLVQCPNRDSRWKIQISLDDHGYAHRCVFSVFLETFLKHATLQINAECLKIKARTDKSFLRWLNGHSSGVDGLQCKGVLQSFNLASPRKAD